MLLQDVWARGVGDRSRTAGVPAKMADYDWAPDGHGTATCCPALEFNDVGYQDAGRGYAQNERKRTVPHQMLGTPVAALAKLWGAEGREKRDWLS